MNRMLITLEDSDKLWLAQESRAEKRSIAQIVRDAIKEYRKKVAQKPKEESFEDLLEATRGIWKDPDDALTYQLKIRSEWDHRP